MTLRTTSLKRQHQAWALLVLLGLVAYIALVLALGLGNPIRFFGSHQMRVLLPMVVLLRLLAREFRWDGTVREEEKKVEKAGEEVSLSGDSGAVGVRALPSAPTPDTCTFSAPQPQHSTSTPSLRPPIFDHRPGTSDEMVEALWERAREMVHNEIPDAVEDAGYLNLIFSAAERGHIPALAKLGDYAFRRGAFVEAYFWTKMARRRAELSDGMSPLNMKEIDDQLRNIRREWAAAEQPPEFENVYENFPEERGELGRAFLRLDAGIEVWQTRKFVQRLADKGNPDAALFVGRSRKHGSPGATLDDEYAVRVFSASRGSGSNARGVSLNFKVSSLRL